MIKDDASRSLHCAGDKSCRRRPGDRLKQCSQLIDADSTSRRRIRNICQAAHVVSVRIVSSWVPDVGSTSVVVRPSTETVSSVQRLHHNKNRLIIMIAPKQKQVTDPLLILLFWGFECNIVFYWRKGGYLVWCQGSKWWANCCLSVVLVLISLLNIVLFSICEFSTLNSTVKAQSGFISLNILRGHKTTMSHAQSQGQWSCRSQKIDVAFCSVRLIHGYSITIII
jgi:hypothetical protein